MEERLRPTKTGIFFIELMIAVGIFSFCAAVCIGLFVYAERTSRDDADLVRAVTEARNLSECYKAAGGDLEGAAALAGGKVENGCLTLRYAGDWSMVSYEEDEAVFTLTISKEGDEMGAARLNVESPDNPSILSWPLDVLEDVS